MGRVNTTVSFTPCCTRPPPERAGLRRPGWLWAALVCLLALWIAAIPAAHAQQHGEIVELQLDPLPEGLYLSATLQLELPELVKDALYKGISVFFITEAEVVRQRWYWSDKVVAQASRFLRLSYQPLTRRWRVVQSSTPFAPSGLGVSLGQNFDTLQDALASMQRIARWKIADEGQVDEGVTYVMNFQFRLDTSQLPRPLQIGAVGRSGWNMVLARSVPLSVMEAAR